jgi:predicted nucleotidyltransferase
LAKKPETLHEERTIVYDEAQWKILAELRTKALSVMGDLKKIGVESFVYGSIARGDVSKTSDIDIIIPYPVSSYRIEVTLGKGIHRELVQATPSMVLKGHMYLNQDLTITFPLFKFRSREIEFYQWGGRIGIQDLRDNLRVPGVDKRLVFIEPNEEGHVERGVIGYEHQIARELGVSIDIAKERIRVLTRRDNVGRTGVYLTRPLSDDEGFEEVAKTLVDSDPAIRRTAEKRGG